MLQLYPNNQISRRGISRDHWYLGTMGFSYQDWRGPFYPENMHSRNYLSHYCKHFNAVEIDSTFYGTPRKETVKRWRLVTSDPFYFCVKTPREITHELRLEGVLAQEKMNHFVEVIGLFKNKLGVILLQFPPSFDASNLSKLTNFLGQLPKLTRFAVEFRHDSWHTTSTSRALERFGVSWVATEYPNLPQDIHRTASHIYIRWIGHHGRYGNHTHERVDMEPNLLTWIQSIENIRLKSDIVFGFFNNDYAGFAPGTCNKMMALLGLPTRPLEPPRQARLF